MSKRPSMFMMSDLDHVLEELDRIAELYENPVRVEQVFIEIMRARVRKDFECSRCGEWRRGYSTIIHGEGRVCAACIPEPVKEGATKA